MRVKVAVKILQKNALKSAPKRNPEDTLVSDWKYSITMRITVLLRVTLSGNVLWRVVICFGNRKTKRNLFEFSFRSKNYVEKA